MGMSHSASSVYQDSSIRFKGLIDLEWSLRFFKSWLTSRKYNFFERKFNKKPDIAGHRFKIELEADKRIDPYVKWYILIKIRAHDIVEKEVVIDGKKVIKDYGRIKYKFDCKLQLDPDNRWEDTPFLKKLENFMVGRPSSISQWEMEMIWWDELYYDMYKLKEDFSKALGLYYSG